MIKSMFLTTACALLVTGSALAQTSTQSLTSGDLFKSPEDNGCGAYFRINPLRRVPSVIFSLAEERIVNGKATIVAFDISIANLTVITDDTKTVPHAQLIKLGEPKGPYAEIRIPAKEREKARCLDRQA